MLPRIYDSAFRQHLAEHRRMIFVTGPRQVGKTTTCRALAGELGTYLSWDRPTDRRLILRGSDAVAERTGVEHLGRKPRVVILDEVKTRDERLSPALRYFQRQLHAPHAFQVVIEADYLSTRIASRASPP